MEKTVRLDDRDWAGGFTQIPNSILLNPQISAKAKLVWSGLAAYAWRDEKCWPGQERLAEELVLSETLLRRGLRELEEKGLLETTRRGRGMTNLYVVKTGHSDRSGPVNTTALDRSIRPTKKTKVKKTKKEEGPPSFPDDVRRLCELQAKLAAERTEREPKPVSQAWLAEMDRLIRIDGRSVKQIEYVIKWVHRDPFWGPNVLAVPKLREKFDQLVANIKRADNGSSKKGEKAKRDERRLAAMRRVAERAT